MTDVREAGFRFLYDPETKLFTAKGSIEGKAVMGLGPTVKDALIAAFKMAFPEMKAIETPPNWDMDDPMTKLGRKLKKEKA